MEDINRLSSSQVPDIKTFNDWHKGRSSYQVWMYTIEDTTLKSLASDIINSLSRSTSILESRNLHSTVFVNGFPSARPIYSDDIKADIIDLQVERIRKLSVNPPELYVTRIALTTLAVLLEVSDVSQTTNQIRYALEATTDEIIFGQYYPHITIGHYLSRIPMELISKSIDPQKLLPKPIRLKDITLNLIALKANTPVRPEIGLCANSYTSIYTHQWAKASKIQNLNCVYR